MALAVLACLAAGGCGGGSAGPGAKTPAAAGACPAPVVKAAAERPAPAAVAKVAAAYLAARESALSACRSSATAWEAQAKKLMTPQGWRTRPRDDAGAARYRGQLTRNGWNVRATISCMRNPEAGKPTATWQPLFCSVTDTTVDASGHPVPAARLPAKWPYSGDQNPAPVSMKKRGGAWLVDQDLTGQAQ